MKDLVIIGAGPAGLYAAYYAGLRKIDAVVLESSMEFGGQLSALYPEKPIYDIPGFDKINAKEFIDSLYNQYKKYENEIKIHFEEQVIKIEKVQNGFDLYTTKGVYQAKSILITNGGGSFSPKKLEVGNDSYDNVYYSFPNESLLKDKNILVLGGGDAAVDFALLAKNHSKNTTIVHRRDQFRAHQASVDELKETVNVLTPYVVSDIISEETIVKKVLLQHAQTKEVIEVETDLMGVFYGVNSLKNNYETFLVETNSDGIIVKPNMATSIEGIFAAGNCTSYEGKLKTIAIGLGEVAIAIGAINDYLYPDRNNHVYSSILIK